MGACWLDLQVEPEAVVKDLKALSEELWWAFYLKEAIVLIDNLVRENVILRQALRERHPSPEIIGALSNLPCLWAAIRPPANP